jgi:hypothetical protein
MHGARFHENFFYSIILSNCSLQITNESRDRQHIGQEDAFDVDHLSSCRLKPSNKKAVKENPFLRLKNRSYVLRTPYGTGVIFMGC